MVRIHHGPPLQTSNKAAIVRPFSYPPMRVTGQDQGAGLNVQGRGGADDTAVASECAAAEWAQVRGLFEAVCQLPPAQRQDALQARCGDNRERLAEVMDLLQAADADTPLAPAVEQLLPAPPDTGPPLQPGQRLGPWRLVRHLAEGGMGQVFEGERADGLYQQQVAIKLLHARANPAAAARLAAERQILAGLQLPGVARLYDGGSTDDGHPYLVMEYVEGTSLDRWSADPQHGLVRRLQVFLAVCRIVHAAHAKLVLHCDLKPGNVHVRADGTPVLLDFGVSRLLSDVAVTDDFCTPGYASPEQLSGQAVGVGSDVYSLGVMLVELLAARPGAGQQPTVPLASEWSGRQVAWQRRLRGDLDAITRRACASNPQQRYLTVGGLIADLEAYLERRPVKARGGGMAYAWRLALHRNWRGWSLLLLLALVAGVLVHGLYSARREALKQALVAGQVSRFLVDTFELADPAKRSGRGAEQMTARQLLDQAAARVGRDLARAPVEQARMRSVLGEAYHNIGEPLLARKLLSQAVDDLLDPAVAQPVEAARVLAKLSEELTAGGNGVLGLQAAERGLDLLPSRGNALVRAGLLSASGYARTNMQQFPVAERDLKRALALLEQAGSVEAAVLKLGVAERLTQVYWRWGRLPLAQSLLRRVIADIPESDLAQRLELEIRLARVMREQGLLDSALPVLQDSLVKATGLYGEHSRHVLELHDALADLQTDRGQWQAALEHYRLRQQLGEQVEGADSLGMAMLHFNRAVLEQMRGNLARAGQLYDLSWQLRVARLGPDVPMSWRAAVGLGQWHLLQGRVDTAGALIVPASDGLEASLPADAPGRIEAQIARAQWELAAGQRARALRRYRQLDAQGATMPVPMRLQLYELCQALHPGADTAKTALRCAEHGVSVAMVHFGERAPATALARLHLAEQLARDGQRERARMLARQAAQVLEPLQVADSPLRPRLQALQR